MFREWLIFAAVSWCQDAAQQRPAHTGRIVIRGVAVVDVDKGVLIENQDVVIRGENVEAIVAGDSFSAGDEDEIVDGSSRFLIPALVDAHVHFADPQNFAEMCLVHGVTLVRDLGGETGQVLKNRADLESGAMLGPQMLVTGAILDGKPPIWPFSRVCNSAEEAAANADYLIEQGVDQVKVYSMLKSEAHAAIIETAHSLGVLAVGHVPVSVTLEEAIERGQNEVQHLTGFGDCLGRLAGRKRAADYVQDFSNLDAFEELTSEQYAPLFAKIKAAGMAQCPTLIVYQSMATMLDPKVDEDPRLQCIAPYIHSFWKSGRYEFAKYAGEIVPVMQKIVKALHEAEVPLICGSDLANAYVFPGESLHQEMALFQEAGIAPAEALRSATIRPCRHFGIEDRLGSIAAGRTASLVLLGRNPLEDVRNTQAIEAVFLRGRYLSRTALDDLQEGVRRRVKAIEAEFPRR